MGRKGRRRSSSARVPAGVVVLIFIAAVSFLASNWYFTETERGQALAASFSLWARGSQAYELSPAVQAAISNAYMTLSFLAMICSIAFSTIMIKLYSPALFKQPQQQKQAQ